MSSNIFEQSITNYREKLNTFNLSHTVKLTGNMGYLIPILKLPVIPDDRIKLSHEVKVKFAPLIAPIMDEIDCVVHDFYVPNRILWQGVDREDSWKTFLTGGKTGRLEPVFPYITVTQQLYTSFMSKSTLSDYLGIPQIDADFTGNPFTISALPFRAYQQIYNDYYRNANIQGEILFNLDGGEVEDIQIEDSEDSSRKMWQLRESLLQLRKINWRKDYFTSALPWAQRGGDVLLPIGGYAPVVSENGQPTNLPSLIFDGGNYPQTNVNLKANFNLSDDGSTWYKVGIDDQGSQFHNAKWFVNGSGLSADLSSASAVTVNDLRKMFQLQRFLEINAIGGSRYNEVIWSHFGVRVPDARIQRPIYLGGKKISVQVSEVLQTSESTETSPQGNMTGLANTYGYTDMSMCSVQEHGYIISIMCVRPNPSYKQGLERDWRKFDKYDFYWPEFAHLGEQPVYRSELYLNPNADLENTFGYQSRYSEYKFMNSRVHGDFRDTLEYWTLVRDFENTPMLNEEFITCNPSSRIFAVEDETVDKLRIEVYNQVYATRAMPVFGTPKIV